MSAFFVAMPPITATLQVSFENLKQLAEKIKYTTHNVNRDFNIRRRPVDAKTLAFIRFTPAKPHYPIVWQSERQRRAFWATNGFGKGIPYSRTGKLMQSWTIPLTETTDGGSISLDNSEPYSIYVQGDLMQDMHIASGYHSADSAVDMFAPDYAAVLVNSFYVVGE